MSVEEAKSLEEFAAAKARDTLQRARQGWTHDADIREAAERVAEDAIDEDLAIWLVAASRFDPKLKRLLLEALTEIYLEQIEDECDES